MRKLKIFFVSLILLGLLNGCQTIKNKTNKIVQEENKKLSQYIGKTSNYLQTELGKPDEDFKNEKVKSYIKFFNFISSINQLSNCEKQNGCNRRKRKRKIR